MEPKKGPNIIGIILVGALLVGCSGRIDSLFKPTDTLIPPTKLPNPEIVILENGFKEKCTQLGYEPGCRIFELRDDSDDIWTTFRIMENDVLVIELTMTDRWSNTSKVEEVITKLYPHSVVLEVMESIKTLMIVGTGSIDQQEVNGYSIEADAYNYIIAVMISTKNN